MELKLEEVLSRAFRLEDDSSGSIRVEGRCGKWSPLRTPERAGFEDVHADRAQRQEFDNQRVRRGVKPGDWRPVDSKCGRR